MSAILCDECNRALCMEVIGGRRIGSCPNCGAVCAEYEPFDVDNEEDDSA